VLSQLGKALFQSTVDKVEIAHVAAVGPFIHHSLQETLDKHHVLGHGVGLLGALSQLGRQAVVPVIQITFFILIVLTLTHKTLLANKLCFIRSPADHPQAIPRFPQPEKLCKPIPDPFS
jgi:hypothetical protein